LNQVDIVKWVKKFSERWMVTTALMIAGGLLGLLVSQVRPPIFESAAIFSVTIDYTQTGALTDIQEDQAMRGVGSVILSDRVIKTALSLINKERGTVFSQSGFLDNSFLDREEFRWTLRFRDPDPKIAEMAVNTWSRSADAAIREGLAHSLSSKSLLEDLEIMKTCLFNLPNGDSQTNCENSDLNSVVKSINEISAQIQTEKAASQGLFHALSVSLVNSGISSGTAELGQRNFFVLSGALVGLFLSMIMSLVEEMKRSRAI